MVDETTVSLPDGTSRPGFPVIITAPPSPPAEFPLITLARTIVGVSYSSNAPPSPLAELPATVLRMIDKPEAALAKTAPPLIAVWPEIVVRSISSCALPSR